MVAYAIKASGAGVSVLLTLIPSQVSKSKKASTLIPEVNLLQWEGDGKRVASPIVFAKISTLISIMKALGLHLSDKVA